MSEGLSGDVFQLLFGGVEIICFEEIASMIHEQYKIQQCANTYVAVLTQTFAVATFKFK
jgi:hypothetical protein